MHTDSIVLHMQEVQARIGQRTVLEHVTFSIHKGEFVYLTGRSGAGKSSILRLIYADLFPVQGSIRLGDIEYSQLNFRKVPFLRRRLGIVFQDFQLLSDRTVSENLRLALRATGWEDRDEINRMVTEALVKVDLSAKLTAYPHQLSGGEQQRAAIARALLNDPLLIIADEPTGNLDTESAERIMLILRQINDAGTAVLMATHSEDLLRKFPARTLHVQDGTLTER